jgi:hypothetical protein
MVNMDLADEYEPIILLNDGETLTALGGCELIVLTREEAERVANDDSLGFVKVVEAHRRIFDLEIRNRLQAVEDELVASGFDEFIVATDAGTFTWRSVALMRGVRDFGLDGPALIAFFADVKRA